MLHRVPSFLALCLLPGLAAAADCGAPDAPCEIDGGRYFFEAPPDPKGVVVFLHGYGGTGTGTMQDRTLVTSVLARGFAFAAPDGMPRPGGQGMSWSFNPAFPHARDEAAFFAMLFDDLAARHQVPRDRVLMAGFSAGGFMTSYLACADPDIAAAFAPVSGGFWRPDPESCAGPVRLFHTHGWSDTTVPLEGRYLRNGTAAQADIWHGMEIWRQTNHCDAMRPDAFSSEGPFWRRSWTACAPGSSLEFALFPGGHMIPEGWADMVLTWFEALPARS